MADLIALLIVGMVCSSLLYAQRQAYAFEREKRAHKENMTLSAELEKRLKEVMDLKKNVDALLIKGGLFK